MNRRRKVQLLAGVPAPASAVITTQRTESSADPAAPAQRGEVQCRGRFTKEQLGVNVLNHHLKAGAGGFGIAREGGACYNKHHGEDYDCLRIQGTIQSQPLSMAAATKVPNWWGNIIFGLNWFMNLIKLSPDRRADPRRLLALSRMTTPPDVMTLRAPTPLQN